MGAKLFRVCIFQEMIVHLSRRHKAVFISPDEETKTKQRVHPNVIKQKKTKVKYNIKSA